MINLFIGYDARESVVFHTCVNSIIRRSTTPISVTPLALNNLDIYNEHHSDGSNPFIYSRFLVPFLQNYSGWAIYIDGDMLLRDDISKLWDLKESEKALLVVKHKYKTKSKIKYMGSKNEDYPRKNWSSVVMWNCSHPSNKILTPQYVEQSSGSFLHRFSWLPDDLIGDLPIEWNWLPDEFGYNKNAKLNHFTIGAPCFHEYATVSMGDEWHRERMLMNYCIQRTNIHNEST